MRVARRGIGAGLGTVMAVVAAAAGIYIAAKVTGRGNGGVKPFTLQETVPRMVGDFGAKTRVVQISVSHNNVDNEVIPSDGRLHIRNYDVVQYEVEAGTTGYNRKVTDVVRAPSAGETSAAHVTLGAGRPR